MAAVTIEIYTYSIIFFILLHQKNWIKAPNKFKLGLPIIVAYKVQIIRHDI